MHYLTCYMLCCGSVYQTLLVIVYCFGRKRKRRNTFGSLTAKHVWRKWSSRIEKTGNIEVSWERYLTQQSAPWPWTQFSSKPQFKPIHWGYYVSSFKNGSIKQVLHYLLYSSYFSYYYTVSRNSLCNLSNFHIHSWLIFSFNLIVGLPKTINRIDSPP